MHCHCCCARGSRAARGRRKERGAGHDDATIRRRRQRRPARSERASGSRREGNRSSPQSAEVARHLNLDDIAACAGQDEFPDGLVLPHVKKGRGRPRVKRIQGYRDRAQLTRFNIRLAWILMMSSGDAPAANILDILHALASGGQLSTR